jgi:hypothetical protein
MNFRSWVQKQGFEFEFEIQIWLGFDCWLRCGQLTWHGGDVAALDWLGLARTDPLLLNGQRRDLGHRNRDQRLGFGPRGQTLIPHRSARQRRAARLWHPRSGHSTGLQGKRSLPRWSAWRGGHGGERASTTTSWFHRKSSSELRWRSGMLGRWWSPRCSVPASKGRCPGVLHGHEECGGGGGG